MSRGAVLAAFDEQLRRSPRPSSGRVEREGAIVRVVGEGWSGVTWSDLDERTADRAIAAEIERFARPGKGWEWKHYSYDQPADLPLRLRAAGLLAEPTESLLVAEASVIAAATPPPAGVRIVRVGDREAVRAMLALQREVFGDEAPGLEREMIEGLAQRPASTLGLLAFANERPVAAGRIEFNPGAEFAGIWGGCTHPDWRGRGIFRALVASRAALAAERGYRWVQVDAAEMSRPILLRLGFEELAKTTPYVLPL